MTIKISNKPFDPSQYQGTNDSLTLAISTDGSPEYDVTYEIKARCGRAVRLAKGEHLTITNPSGKQVCDLWTFAFPNLAEFMSMEHSHTALSSTIPKVGDTLVTNARNPILTFAHDSSPGVHDTVIAACDLARYQQLGCEEYHDNCSDNLRMALAAIGLKALVVPTPFNIWMNTPVANGGKILWQTPVSSAGDNVVFRAEQDCIAVMSACPQDLTPINGLNQSPSGLTFLVNHDK
ncbi:MAG: DUF1989 domain-containing protein [Cellvibrionaceae bacterium]